MTRLVLRLDFPTGAKLGPGKVRLLELIAAHGSIRAAGAAMEMSYRRAWLLVDSMNRTFDQPVIETQHGGRQGGGAALTAFGSAVVERYRRMERMAEQAVASDLAALSNALGHGDALPLRPDPDLDAGA